MTTTPMHSEDKRNFGNVVSGRDLRSFGDQADGVRQAVMARPHAARVVAVTSGKGGVGKTNVSVNLAIALAQRQKKVVLVDLDLGLANADILSI